MIFNLIIPNHFWFNVLLDKKKLSTFLCLGQTNIHGEYDMRTSDAYRVV